MKSLLIAVLAFFGSVTLTTSADAQTTNTLWGYYQTTLSVGGDNESFDIPFVRLLGKKELSERLAFVGEYNMVTGKPHILDMRYQMSPRFQFDAGALLTITTYDHPGPWNVYFPSTPLLKLNPQFTDEGAQISFSQNNVSAQAALYNGQGILNQNEDGNLDVAGRINYSFPALEDSYPASLSVVCQFTPDQDRFYGAMFATVDFPRAQFNCAWAVRENGDDSDAAAHINLISRINPHWSVGLQGEVSSLQSDTGLLLSAQRQLDWRSRLEANLHLREELPPQYELRYQQAMDFLK